MKNADEEVGLKISMFFFIMCHIHKRRLKDIEQEARVAKSNERSCLNVDGR